MSPNQNQSPVKMIISDEFYEAIARRRAAQGVPQIEQQSSFISESDAKALAADEANRRTIQAAAQEAAKHVPPPPTRGPLCRAAKAKAAERNASIPGFERHSRKCQVCRSPYVEHIETLYLQWESVQLICRYFQLEDADTIYRHARAAGLDVLRRQNSRWVVEQFIEQWRNVKITAPTVIRSIRALSCLDDKGRWTEPPQTHILLRGTDPRSSESGPPEQSAHSTTETVSRPNEQTVSSTTENRFTSTSTLPESLSAVASAAGLEQTRGPFSNLKPLASSVEPPET